MTQVWSREPKRQILILGLGHIGASLAANLSRAGWGVWGWDKNPQALAHCRRKAWIYHVAGPESLPSRAAKLCVVAVPEGAVEDRELLKMLKGLPRGTIVTDLFSSKAEGTRVLAKRCRALGLRHVWSHPLAGREGSGASSADPNLFKGATVLIEKSGDRASLRAVSAFWRTLECRVEFMTAGEHQKSMAQGSHLMHVIAFSATNVAARGGRVSPSVLSATRVAQSNPELWAEILSSNKAEVLRATAQLQSELKKLAALIRGSKRARLRNYLSQAQKLRLKMGSHKE